VVFSFESSALLQTADKVLTLLSPQRHEDAKKKKILPVLRGFGVKKENSSVHLR
jgi:hypothetical protein